MSGAPTVRLDSTHSSPVGLYQLLLQPLLFRLDPERAHDLTLGLLLRLAQMPSLLKLWQCWQPLEHAALQTQVAGLHFPNPVGLAAGFDKSATAVAAFQALGFGFVEVGTVTPRPQVGNPLPRLFRFPADEAVINRMGFNNDGAAAAAQRLKLSLGRTPIGVNLGKNADTPLEQALNGSFLPHDLVEGRRCGRVHSNSSAFAVAMVRQSAALTADVTVSWSRVSQAGRGSWGSGMR